MPLTSLPCFAPDCEARLFDVETLREHFAASHHRLAERDRRRYEQLAVFSTTLEHSSEYTRVGSVIFQAPRIAKTRPKSQTPPVTLSTTAITFSRPQAIPSSHVDPLRTPTQSSQRRLPQDFKIEEMSAQGPPSRWPPAVVRSNAVAYAEQSFQPEPPYTAYEWEEAPQAWVQASTLHIEVPQGQPIPHTRDWPLLATQEPTCPPHYDSEIPADATSETSADEGAWIQ